MSGSIAAVLEYLDKIDLGAAAIARARSLPQQFDAYVWFDETTPVTPLGAEHIQPGIPDTYPFGL